MQGSMLSAVKYLLKNLCSNILVELSSTDNRPIVYVQADDASDMLQVLAELSRWAQGIATLSNLRMHSQRSHQGEIALQVRVTLCEMVGLSVLLSTLGCLHKAAKVFHNC